ncbi:uncharacterized protein LOC113663839 isoform X3 [Tachysurus fulvidraco]|uniref:uncharacterized protein LOC113663839 isoform X3 n=1 Tax=Tachysurus fulvidraco TaxID=1234273 RepID=UPI001FF009EC|nr:uncharacterized protein LOC113663839 isoform X3 [Tachysurus fulvidraco]
MDSKCLEIAALGRPLYPGMLYDCRSDSFIPGVTLWDKNALHDDLDVNQKPKTHLKFAASDSLSDKANLLDISASLKASFLCGLVEVGGSAKYLQDTRSSARQSRVTMQYSQTTTFEQLTMKELGNITYPQVFDHKTATHVVTAVLYGAQVFMVFDYTSAENENKQEIEGNLHAVVKKIPTISIEGQTSLNMTEDEKKVAENISITFYGDIKLEENPTTYKEALHVYRKVPELMKQQGKGVPLTVWLYPLYLLDDKAAKLVREISLSLLCETERLLEELGKKERICNDLIKREITDDFPDIKNRLLKFQALHRNYTSLLKKALCRVLPAIRGGTQEDKTLRDILSIHDTSPFNVSNMNKWLDDITAELNILSSYTACLKDITVVKSSGSLNSICLHPDVDVVVCLSFTSLKHDDSYLAALQDFNKSEKFKMLGKTSERVSILQAAQPWITSPDISARMRQNLSLFTSFLKANKNEKRIKFIIASISDPSNPGTSIQLYQNGSLTDPKFQPVSKPPKPEVETSYESVILKLSKSPTGETVHFRVEYRMTPSNDSAADVEEWTVIDTSNAQNTFTLTGLKPTEQYWVRYRAVSDVGVSEASNSVQFTTIGKLTVTEDQLNVSMPSLITELRTKLMTTIGMSRWSPSTIKSEVTNIVNNPTIPYTEKIPGRLREGKALYFQGVVFSDCQSFILDFVTAEGDVAFHFRPSFNKHSCCNSFVNKKWQDEEHVECNISKGSAFDIFVVIRTEGYEVYVNGQKSFLFSHRVPMAKVNAVKIRGDVKMNTVGTVANWSQSTFGKELNTGISRTKLSDIQSDVPHPVCNPSKPYLRSIPGGLRPGLALFFQGVVPSDCKRFSINLKTGQSDQDDIAFHFNPRISSVVLNTRRNGKWDRNWVETPGGPFVCGAAFYIIMVVKPECYEVMVNGQVSYTFEHRIPVDKVTTLNIVDDVFMNSFAITEFCFNRSDNLSSLDALYNVMDSRCMEIAALGRPLYPGMLYDCRSDSFIPGVTLWDQNALHDDLDQNQNPKTHLKFAASDSLSDKANLLDISASLKASFLCGLVEVGGSAKYLQDTRSSAHQSRVTMQYSQTTTFEQLTMKELGNITYPQVFDQKTATHVVTAVQYGAQVFMVFDYTSAENENKQEIEGNLHAVVKKIPTISIEGQTSLNMTEDEKKMAENISITFYGDIKLEENPTTYKEALHVYMKVPDLMKQQDKGVPLTVWLYPLYLLDEKAAKLVREIDLSLLCKTESLLEEFCKKERICNDLINSQITVDFPDIQDRLEKFQALHRNYTSLLKKALCRVLPAIRGGTQEDKTLRDILSMHDTSPFNVSIMNKWLDDITTELNILSSYTVGLKDITVVKSSGSLNSICLHPDVDVVVCLSFTSLKHEDSYLAALQDFNKSEEFKMLGKTSERVSILQTAQPWFTSPDISARMRQNLSLFTSFLKANKNEKRIKFIIASISDPSNPGNSIQLYQNGFLTDPKFQPVSKPPKPEVETSDGKVILKLSKSPTGKTVHFRVEYRMTPSNDSAADVEEWTVIDTSNAQNTFTLTGLKPTEQYWVRYRAVSDVGVSESSDSVPFTTIGKLTVTEDQLNVSMPSLITELRTKLMTTIGMSRWSPSTIKSEVTNIVNNPTIPYTEKIPGRLREGKALYFQGVVFSDGQSFTLDFVTDEGDVAFHFRPSFNKHSCCNSYVIKYWQDEVRVQCNISKGSAFDIFVVIKTTGHEVYVNGQKSFLFSQRVPMAKVNVFQIRGDVKMNTVGTVANWSQSTFGKELNTGISRTKLSDIQSDVPHPVCNPSKQYLRSIPGGLRPGLALFFQGVVPSDFERFAINLQTGSETAFHFNPRMSSVVLNSHRNGTWDQNWVETPGGPFVCGAAFDIIMVVKPECYEVMVNGQVSYTFKHRIPVDKVTTLNINGDVFVNRFAITEFCFNRSDNLSSLDALYNAVMDSRCMKIAALGRPLYPGMLYDCRSDSFIPGVTLWDKNALHDDLDVHQKPEADLKFSASDSLSDKANLLDISASLKASFLCGLVEVGGSAKYLQDTRSSARQSRVTMQYSQTTTFEQLTMKELGNITYPQVFDQKTATHVVTAVLYGAQVFMVFDYTSAENENKQEIEGKLHAVVKKIPTISIEGQTSFNMTEDEKKMAENISVTFYGDIELEENPTSYNEALEVYNKVPAMLKQQGKGVPLTVWLYPLYLLDDRAAKLVREINSSLLCETESLLEELWEMERICNDLIKREITDDFPDIKNRLLKFQALHRNYTSLLKNALCRVLPAIRGGTQEDKTLRDILSIRDTSSFNVNIMNKWLDDITTELNILSSYTVLKDIKVVKSSGSLKSICLHPDVDVVVCLSFTSLKHDDSYLAALQDFNKSEEFKMLGKTSERVSILQAAQPWFTSPNISTRMRQNLSLFTSFLKANKNEKRIKFIIASVSDPSNPGTSIQLYQNGSLTDPKFQPVSKPPKPEVETSYGKVTLKLSKSPTGETVHFRVEYRMTPSNDSAADVEEWTVIDTSNAQNTFTLTGLQPTEQYWFRYRAVSDVGVSEASDSVPFTFQGKLTVTVDQWNIFVPQFIYNLRRKIMNSLPGIPRPVCNPSEPYLGSIPGGLRPGVALFFQGKIPSHCDRYDDFEINLQNGPKYPHDIAFHFNPRMSSVVLDSYRNKTWENAVWLPAGPFVRNAAFDIIMVINPECYKVLVNGQKYCTFKHRRPLDTVTAIFIKGNIFMNTIAIINVDDVNLNVSVSSPGHIFEDSNLPSYQ